MRISLHPYAVWLVAVCVSLGLVGSVEARNATWEVSTLEGPSGFEWYGTIANDVSDTGYVGGAWLDEDFAFHAAYWYDGACYDLATEIGQPDGTTRSNVLSINSAGLLGGNASSSDGSLYVAMLWDVRHGTWESLTVDVDDLVYSTVKGVNASGDAVGEIVQAPYDTPYGWLKSACIWPHGETEGQVLPGTSDYYYSEATGISSNGTITGWGVAADFTWHALLWTRGSGGTYGLVDLQDEVFADTDVTDCTAFDVSESGEVVGYLWKDYDYTVPPLPFAWTANHGVEELDVDGTEYGIVWKVDANYAGGGIGVGGGFLGIDIADDAVVWWKGELIVAVASFGDYVYCEAASVTSDGTLVGIGLMEYDEDDPATWYPLAFLAER